VKSNRFAYQPAIPRRAHSTR